MITDTLLDARSEILHYVEEQPHVYAPYVEKIALVLQSMQSLLSDLNRSPGAMFAQDQGPNLSVYDFINAAVVSASAKRA